MSEWELVYSKTYPYAYSYTGKATYEEAIFLVDPMKLLFGNWVNWVKNDLPKEIEKQWEENGVKGLRLEIYIGKEKYLWGLIEYPKIRVISIHTSGSIVLILILLIGLAIIVWAIFHEAKEIDWKALFSAMGETLQKGLLPIILLLAVIMLLSRRGRD
jgi:hypothetical protein